MATTKQKRLPKGNQTGKSGLKPTSKAAKAEKEIQGSGPFGKLRVYLKVLGPGMITGAADDDPSGIATYSQTGAQFGYGQLWSMLLMLPMMISIQDACARIGLTKGKGLAGVIKEHYPPFILFSAVCLILVANVINLAA